MSERELVRWAGALLAAGGISYVLFMVIHPYDQLAGAEAMLHPRWIPAHTFHFMGALLTLFGLIGLYARQFRVAGRFAGLAFLLAFAGTTMFAGTGMITAYIWPVMATHSPDLVAGEGAVFTDRLSTLTTSAPYALMVPGFVLIGVQLLRQRVLQVAAVLLIVGAVLFAAPVDPVGPAPWITRVAGGVIFGTALAWIGVAMFRRPSLGPATGVRHPVR